MQTIELPSPCTTVSSRQGIHEPLQVVALYEGLVSLVYARETLQALALGAAPAPVQSSLWSFDMLMMRDLHEASARLATEVDLLIVAGSRSSPLPARVKSWITRVLGSSSTAPVIVAIYEEDEQEPVNAVYAMQDDLMELAARWNTSLLCNTEFDERLEASLMPELAAHQTLRRAGKERRAHRPPLSQPVRYYGIND